MIETYNFLQAKYVGKFQCNGKKCNARCCKAWKITIDDDTLKRYSEIESEAKEITSQIVHEKNFNVVKLDAKRFCPFLTKENFCGIQKKYGEDFLSVTCRTYPRISRFINGIFENSLTLSCPVAAESALTSTDSMEFELVQKSFDSEKNALNVPSLPPEVLPNFLDVQLEALAILKNKLFTIDQRLAVLGFFIERADELIKLNQTYDIPKLLQVYKSKEFLTETMPPIFNTLPFQASEFVKVLLSGVIESLYGENDSDKPKFESIEKLIFNRFNELLKAGAVNDDSIIAFGELRGKFVKKFEQVFENYLVNEFFMNLYPYRLKKSVVHNYGVYLATYKIIEMFAFLMAETCPPVYESDIAKFICRLSTPIEHNADYLNKISNELDGKENMLELIEIFLQP